MCNNLTTSEECRCIVGILKVILEIQRKSHPEPCELQTCDRHSLGDRSINLILNTRPIHLFLCCHNGTEPLEMPTTNDAIKPSTKFSNVFRIEKIDECCATFRVLEEINGPKTEFEATDSFFTLDLKCVCAIKCLQDTYVEGL